MRRVVLRVKDKVVALSESLGDLGLAYAAIAEEEEFDVVVRGELSHGTWLGEEIP